MRTRLVFLLLSLLLLFGSLSACTPVEESKTQTQQVQDSQDSQPQLLSAPSAPSTPSITTCSQVMQLADLPFNQGQVALSRIRGSLVGDCFRAIYPNYGNGYLHSSDHYAALRVILEREPTFREVYDSYHLGGSRNIDLARVKSGGGQRPLEWATMDAQARLYAVLVHRYGISMGSKILDGKVKDPRPLETEALWREWSGVGPMPTPTPGPGPNPTPTPTPSPIGFSGILTLTENGITRQFKLVEIPKQ